MLRHPTSTPTVRDRIVLAGVAALATALLTTMVFGTRGLLHLRALRREEGALTDRIAATLHENDQLRARLQRLREDDRYLERVAREQLGFVHRGEIIYRFPDHRRLDRPDPR